MSNRMLALRRCVLVCLGCIWILSDSHRSLPEGVTCGSQFSDSSAALTIPNPKISWAAYRILTCDAPVMWLQGEMDAGQRLSFTIGLPLLSRFSSVRLALVVSGPGLPSLTEDKKSRVPNSILTFMEASGEGGILLESPQDQSTCAHVMSPAMKASTQVTDGRCIFHEEYGDSYSWVLIDNNITTIDAGMHHFALYSLSDTTAKAWFACCDWPEDFRTRFDVPESECPYCGTKASFGSWGDHFYEQRSMAQYGGFPAYEQCSAERSAPPPTEDQCPPVRDSAQPSQSENCQLGCSRGVCHSHNVLGECVYEMAWITPTPKLGNANVSRLLLFVNETVFFTSAGHYFPHNLMDMKSESSLADCDFTGSIEVGNVGDLRVGKAVKFSNAGTYYYSCQIRNHCSYGQRLTVEVRDVSEGTRCHGHEQRESKASRCHCHSYEHIGCSSDGDALYDEHIEEIIQYCQGVVSGTDAECPYKCFQPYEILHQHYLECGLRDPHPLYEEIAVASVDCHKAAPASSDDNCEATPGIATVTGVPEEPEPLEDARSVTTTDSRTTAEIAKTTTTPMTCACIEMAHPQRGTVLASCKDHFGKGTPIWCYVDLASSCPSEVFRSGAIPGIGWYYCEEASPRITTSSDAETAVTTVGTTSAATRSDVTCACMKATHPKYGSVSVDCKDHFNKNSRPWCYVPLDALCTSEVFTSKAINGIGWSYCESDALQPVRSTSANLDGMAANIAQGIGPGFASLLYLAIAP